MGMMADEYMAKFEMLADRTGFNDAALVDMFIQGLPQSNPFQGLLANITTVRPR